MGTLQYWTMKSRQSLLAGIKTAKQASVKSCAAHLHQKNLLVTRHVFEPFKQTVKRYPAHSAFFNGDRAIAVSMLTERIQSNRFAWKIELNHSFLARSVNRAFFQRAGAHRI